MVNKSLQSETTYKNVQEMRSSRTFVVYKEYLSLFQRMVKTTT